ncbi:MAG: HDIG domain-containing protein [Candidatus Hydrogenedentes bacterium]|nr:HDIG domain-containing protein [Candidatus Hydrogenedentota bacterium]
MIGRFAQKKARLGAFAQRASANGDSGRARERYLRRTALGAALVVIVFAVTRVPEQQPQSLDRNIDKQIVSTERFQAAFFFESVDLEKTEQARAAAAAKVPYTYRVRRDRVREQLARVEERITAIRAHWPGVSARILAGLRASTSAQTPKEVVAAAVSEYIAGLGPDALPPDAPEPAMLASWLTPDLFSLPDRVFAEPEEAANSETGAAEARKVVALNPETSAPFSFGAGEALARMAREDLEFVLSQGVRNAELAPDLLERRVVILRDDAAAGQQLSDEQALASVPNPSQAAELLGERLENSAKLFAREQGDPDFDWGKLSDAALAVTAPALSDTLYLDEDATRNARQQAGNAVEPVMKEIQAHEIIQDEGERWTAQSRSDVRTYLEKLQLHQRPAARLHTTIAAHVILGLLALACLRRAITLFGAESPAEQDKQLYVGLLLLCGILLAGRIAYYFDPSGFLLPVAAAAILYAILINVRLAALFTVVVAGLVSAQYGYDWRVAVLAMGMSLAGVFSIFKVRRRSDMTAATLKATFAGLLTMLALILATDSVFSEAAARHLLLIGLNGFLCLFLVPGVLSPLERLFGITTDIQLLEYSDLNNEVLGRLAMEVPATWSHSLMMGQLAEAVSEAVGANGLMARVCAYYHDIGKMRRPEYFTENQKGFNIHDELTPRLSARAIAAHVLYGVELAREYHLPKPVIDGILEHHGTTMIGFFYQQAKEQQKHSEVCEADFRYPGPKPQRRETAILMICDAVESGVRSIKNPNEERVREFIDKIIAIRAADGQFDECGLTMKDLNVIASLLTQRVLSASHTRIAYPEMKKDKDAQNIIRMPGGAG